MKKNKKTIKVAITGNRYPLPTDQRIIQNIMKKLVLNKKVSEIIFGGAIGVDSIALIYALQFRAQAATKLPKLTVIVPDEVSNQPKSTREVTALANQIIELKNEITDTDGYKAYRVRNEEMVKRADRIVAFWNGVPRSGTFMTINLAKKYKKAYEIIDIQGKD